MSPFEPFVWAPAAFLAGVLMFLAPCTLPIVPGYLAFIAGGQGRVVRNAFAFVLGFSFVFIVLGAFAGFFGALLVPWQGVLGRAAGALIFLFGLTMLGVLRLPLLSGEQHIRIPGFLTLGRPESSALIGALFALGWSPCIGPILGTILLFASTSATALQGAILLGIFSAGLGMPFVLCAIFLKQLSAYVTRMGPVATVLSYIGGIALLFLGALMFVGQMGALVSWGYYIFGFMNYDALLEHL